MPRLKSSVFFLIWLGVGLGGISGCAPAHKPPPLVGDRATALSVHHFLGTPLSGTVLKAPNPITPPEALYVEVAFVAIERLPTGTDPLGARARLIIASHGTNPVRSTGSLTRSASFATGIEAERLAESIDRGVFGQALIVGRENGALPIGATARFEIADKPETSSSAAMTRLGHRRFQVQICRSDPYLFTHSPPATRPATEPSSDVETPTAQPTTAPADLPGAAPATPLLSAGMVPIEMAVVLDDDAAAPDSHAAGESAETISPTPGAGSASLHLETVLLDPFTLGPMAMTDRSVTAVVVVPFRFRDGRNQAVAAVVWLKKGSASDAGYLAACERATRDLNDSFIAARADADSRPPASPDAATIDNLLAGMSQPASRRSATAYLAAWSGGRICEDVSLSADEQRLAELVETLRLAVAKTPAEKLSVGWALDVTALSFLAGLQANAKLSPELAAILSDRAGEAGRHASAMEEILRGVRGPTDLDDRFVAANRLYLEDSSPASRARAYDWLKNRNRHEEPAGYAALSPSRDRRAALDRDATLRAAAATQPSVVHPAGVP